MTLPVESVEGYIEASDDEVLGVVDSNNPEAKVIPISEEQIWHRGTANENGWFLLTNPHTGQVLTKVGNYFTTIDGNIIFQSICTLISKLSGQPDIFLGSGTLKDIRFCINPIFSGCVGTYFFCLQFAI